LYHVHNILRVVFIGIRYIQKEKEDTQFGDKMEKSAAILKKYLEVYLERIVVINEANFPYVAEIYKLVIYEKNSRGCLIDGLASGSTDFGDFCQNILDKFENLWAFTKSGDIDPTNNLAERDLRSLVLWRKKSYGTRSERGKRFAERISSVAGTLRRKGLNAINFLKEAVCAFYRGEEAPYLCAASGF
jgi:transposase